MTSENQAMVSDGEILDLLPDGNYKIKVHGTDFEVKAYKGGKMRRNHIKLLPGDRVQVEINPYEITKGRIIYRYKRNPYEVESENNHQGNYRRNPTNRTGGSRNPRHPSSSKGNSQNSGSRR